MSIPKKLFRGNKAHSRMPNPRFRKSHNAIFQNKVAGNMLHPATYKLKKRKKQC